MKITDPQSGKSYFSKRRHRHDADRTPRSLTFSCYKRFPFLSRDRSRRWFVEALSEARTRWPVDLWAYVIMPEHVHLLVAPREVVEVGRFVGAVKEQVSRTAISWMEAHAPQWLSRITVREGKTIRRRFWQPGGGFDRNVDSDRALLSIIAYLHQNPVRRGLVSRPEEWEWSSARWYGGDRNVPLPMDPTLPTTE